MADFQQNFLASLGAGYNFGQQIKQQRDTSRINQLASQAYSAPREQRDAISSQLAALSPEAAQNQRKAWDANDERDQRELMGMARFIKAAPPEQQQNAYEKAIRPQLVARGMQAPEWTPETQGTILQTVDALAQMHQGANGGTIQSQKVSDDGYIINTYRDGRMEKTQQKVDRQMWLRDHPGMGAPELVGKDGSVQAVGGAQSDVGIPGQSIGGLDIARDAQQFASLGIPVSSTLRSGDKNREVGGVANSYHLTGEAIDVAPQSAEQKQQAQQYWRSRGYQVIDEGDHLHIEPPQRGATTSRLGGQQQAFARPSAGQDAAATERAKLQAQQDFLPTELGMRTNSAVDQAVRIDAGKAGAERAAAAPGAISTMQASLTSIDELLDSPDLGSIVGLGSMNPLNRIPGTDARGLIARADQIAGQAFLAAFNQLKGGGAITEREGAAATAAMARLDRSQSLADYKAALTDLKNAITPAMQRQQAALRGQQGQAQPMQSAPASDFSNLWN